MNAEPALNFSPELLLRAQGVKVAFFNVDGVLTDGCQYFSDDPDAHGQAVTPGGVCSAGETIKRLNPLDAYGLKLLQKAGITPAIIAERDSTGLRSWLQGQGIVHAQLGIEDKCQAAEQILQSLGLDWSSAAAMGTDWPDLPMMGRACLSCAPATAHLEVRARASCVTQMPGGHGAAREWCDFLLIASGRYAGLLAGYTV